MVIQKTKKTKTHDSIHNPGIIAVSLHSIKEKAIKAKIKLTTVITKIDVPRKHIPPNKNNIL